MRSISHVGELRTVDGSKEEYGYPGDGTNGVTSAPEPGGSVYRIKDVASGRRLWCAATARPPRPERPSTR